MALSTAAPAAPADRASSEIRRESTGLWLFLDGVRTPAIAGVVYQHTEGDKHIREYANSRHLVYQPLDDEETGGQGHGGRLAQMGFRAIRVYELPVENQQDADRTKEIFRRLYHQHGIKVLVGDWAGLNTGMDFGNANEVKAINGLNKEGAKACVVCPNTGQNAKSRPETGQ